MNFELKSAVTVYLNPKHNYSLTPEDPNSIPLITMTEGIYVFEKQVFGSAILTNCKTSNTLVIPMEMFLFLQEKKYFQESNPLDSTVVPETSDLLSEEFELEKFKWTVKVSTREELESLAIAMWKNHVAKEKVIKEMMAQQLGINF